MSIRLHLFGPPRLTQGRGHVALAFERRSQLLAHLALRRGWVGRTELATTLWPQAPAEQAHANLRKTLFRLRTLPWAPAITVQDQSLGYDGTSDVADFELAIAQRRWADALRIADAPLLAGFDDDSSEPWSTWLRDERARLRAAWRVAAHHCLAAATAPADVLALSARLLEDDPLDEPALRAQMLIYAQLGQPARASAAYQAYATRLTDGLQPSADLQSLHRTLGKPGIPSPDTALPGPDRRPRIIGRTAERRAVHAHLEAGCRLLCLIGPGGVGKSCLARHLSSELAPLYPDGSVYIPLDDADSPDALGARLARELAVHTGGAHPLQAVTAFLSGRRMLLVVDNFEHLQQAAPQLQALLDACPNVQMLVTSRVRLGLASEQLLPLDGLPCPEPEDADCLEAFDAAQLFVRAAQAVEPALQPAAEAAAIVDICRLVDGLPLALEIAAGWTRVLSCQTIAAELRHGIELLTQSDAVRPARHASMAAVFEQSWRRLSPAERSAWARLTVFHGGFTAEAAHAVAGATLPILAALADQSLVRKAGRRTDMHPLLRQLAVQRLADDERAAISAAHAAYFLHWLVPMRTALEHGDRQALQQTEVEFENLRAAWRWASLHGSADALQPAVLPLMRYCDQRGRLPEGLALLREAADGAHANDALLRPLLDVAMAVLHTRQDRNADAQALAERALLASRDTRDHDTRLMCFRVLGNCAYARGQLSLARRRYRQALAQAPMAIDPDNASGILQNLALVEKDLGHYDAARTLNMRALVEYRRLHHAAHEALCLTNLAALDMDTGRLDEAAAHLEAGLALSERHALAGVKMIALTNLTEIAVRRNDAPGVQRYGPRALELTRQMGARGPQTWLQLMFAQFAVQQRDMAAARAALQTAVESAVALDHARLQLDCVLCFADLLAAQGESGAAIRLLRYAIAHPATHRPARRLAQGRLAEWSAAHPGSAALPAPAVDLWTLLHRIMGEATGAHASLIQSLRAP